MLGKIEGRRRRGQQDEMVGWHHWLNGHEFEQTLGDSEGQGSLACCRSWGHKDSDKTEQLNNKILTTVPFPVFLVQLFLFNCFFFSGPSHSYINVWLSKSFQINVWFFLLSHLGFYIILPIHFSTYQTLWFFYLCMSTLDEPGYLLVFR